MTDFTLSKKQLTIASFLQREDNRYHHGYEEELLQFLYLMNGDMRSVRESERLFCGNTTGRLSKDPLRHYKYLFVSSTTLATRYAIRGGLEPQDAYNLSDLYILRADACNTIGELFTLQTEMMQEFTERVAQIICRNNLLSSDNLYIKQIRDYIYLHLHDKIKIEDLANTIGLSANYVSNLFKKETGLTIQAYIQRKKIEVACNMLLYSEYDLTDIGNILAFSSTSHFIKTFKSIMGQTPRQYKMHVYDNK